MVAEPSLNPKPHVAAVEFKLVSAQEREISTVDVAQAWREEVGILPYIRSVAFSGEVLDLGNPVEAILSHPDPDRLVEVAESVVNGLRGIAGVYDIRSNHAPGVREIQLALRPEARTLGLTLEDLAVQMRAAFFGAEALRVQRGREEVRVFVRLPKQERDAVTDLEHYRVRTPTGAEVPLARVASLTTGTSPASIQRQDRRRVVTVSAEVDTAMISAGEANGILADSILADLAELNPGLTYIYGGEQQQQIESLGALFRGFAVVLLAMFAMLAIPLRSYGKPVVVMAIIPFGPHRHDRRTLGAGCSRRGHYRHGFLRLERRRGERLPDDDRLHRSAPPGRGADPDRDRRRCEGAFPADHADLSDDLSRFHAPHPRAGHPSAVPRAVRGHPRHRYPGHHRHPHAGHARVVRRPPSRQRAPPCGWARR